MKQAHNPLTGFHDIKLLPDTGTTDALPGPFVLSIIVLLILVLAFYLWKKLGSNKNSDTTELSPVEEFKENITLLKKRNLAQSSFAELSMALRRYLQRVLSGNHLSLTTAEVQLLISGTKEGSLTRALPLTTKSKLNAFQESVVTLLKQLDSLAFAPLTDKENHLLEEFTATTKTAEELVSLLEDLLMKELENNVTVHTSTSTSTSSLASSGVSSKISSGAAKAKTRGRK